MTALNKQALRQLATDAHELGIIKRYTKGIEANKRFVAIATPLTVLALLDELEAAEERYEDMLRQARSFREAHDSASELIRKLERNKPVVKLPTTKLWAGKVACYEESEIIALLTSAGIGVKGE
ncbi:MULTISPECIES: ead/Ea22-like family protein [Citrobacter]|uniref:Ead/Ea22-like family protein n=1 Tax=Citrobacter braakii TaxID=57706 RepID=A0ABR6U248_CITBR|nr:MULTISPECIES: ead/Ea22-like family protein [Citrobacter]MBC2613162.1 ead/Ea22-like family protein [Citrobacter braakii]MBC2637209.1 ead/Ea22-like family protein [Citrobacter braakii]MBC2649914.1 ead/Ea22-like family protein [Citrobacter braakii]MDM3428838.1 ead/Ea22-like family protein [Citrobacter sp. Cb023]MDM3436899.1 ead/Ea22-like family protein [Citrobacter sp. Cb034]